MSFISCFGSTATAAMQYDISFQSQALWKCCSPTVIHEQVRPASHSKETVLMLTSLWQAALRAGKKQVSLLSADQLLRQQARKPPSTGRVTPFVMLLLSLSRNKMLFTTSSTSAGADAAHSQEIESIKAVWCGYTFISTCIFGQLHV